MRLWCSEYMDSTSVCNKCLHFTSSKSNPDVGPVVALGAQNFKEFVS